MNQKSTIKDIARLLNIHHSTVSRALRNHPDVNQDTKKKVQEAAKRLNYMPNVFARNLKSNLTNFIGVIVPEIEHHFFSSAISGMEKILYDADYVILVCQSNEDFKREVLNTRALISNNVAGLIVSLSQTTVNFDHFRQYMANDGKIVFFDRVPPDLAAPTVVVDDYESAFKATSHLIGLGRRKIAHLAGAEGVTITKLRASGYKDALEQNGLVYDPDLVEFGGFHETDGYTGLKKILARTGTVDAVFAVNDPNAIGAYQLIKEKSLTIPDDVAVVGFSDNPIAAVVTPSLTTIAQPGYQMGEMAARILIDMIYGKIKKQSDFKKVINTKLVIRESTSGKKEWLIPANEAVST